MSQQSAPLKFHQRFEVDLKGSRLTLRFQGYFDSVAVKGIDVILIPPSGEDTLAATSDRNGFVRFDSLAQGRWSVEATGAHHEMDYAVIHPDTKEGVAVSVFLKKKVSLLGFLTFGVSDFCGRCNVQVQTVEV